MLEFDEQTFNVAINNAEKEALGIYHFGHMPPKPVEHKHGLVDDMCSPACTIVWWAKEANKRIQELEAIPKMLTEILNTYEGYEIVPAIQDLTNSLSAKQIYPQHVFNVLHSITLDSEDVACPCEECASGAALSKFGIKIESKDPSVKSVKSLDAAVPGSIVSIYGGQDYTKSTEGKWYSDTSSKPTLTSNLFLSAIMSKQIKWVKRMSLDENVTSVDEDTEVTSTDCPWYKLNAKVETAVEMEFAPAGAVVCTDDNSTKYTKTPEGSWTPFTNGYVYGSYKHVPKEFNVESTASWASKWYWKEPYSGSLCEQQKAEYMKTQGKPDWLDSSKIQEKLKSLKFENPVSDFELEDAF